MHVLVLDEKILGQNQTGATEDQSHTPILILTINCKSFLQGSFTDHEL